MLNLREKGNKGIGLQLAMQIYTPIFQGYSFLIKIIPLSLTETFLTVLLKMVRKNVKKQFFRKKM